jgi:hypothetical protein
MKCVERGFWLRFQNAKPKETMAGGTIKNPKRSITRHIVWDNFEFTKEPNCSFSGVILGNSQGSNDQE